MVTSASSDPAAAPSSRQIRMREKAEEINLVLLEPDVDLWKLRELALSDGGLVNDTIRRRAWPKLVGLTGYQPHEEPTTTAKATTSKKTTGKGTTPRKGTAPTRVTNFGDTGEDRPSTAFTGGPFDQHDTMGVATGAIMMATTTSTEGDDNSSLASDDSANKKSDITECQDAEQIERDVTRCTWHLLTGGQRSRRRIMVNKHRKKVAKVLRRKQRRLGDLINLTLSRSELDLPNELRLCYYQGYHDIASVILAALGGASSKAIQQNQQQQQPHDNDPSSLELASTIEEQAANMGLDLSLRVLYQISMSHFREPMRQNFLQLQTTLRMVFFPLLAMMDPELHAHLYGCGMEPFFALSWVITWFSHDIRDTALVKRLFDVFLVSHPLMPIYLSVAMVCHPNNRQEVLATPCEFAELHSTLAGLPKNSSMVGWKYRVGDGYVSDDDEVGEDGETSISLDSDMASHLSNDRSSHRGGGGGQASLLSGLDGGMGRDNLMLSEGHAHVVSMGFPSHVPFQDLIDLAINFMRRVPPRKLSTIAQRYYGPEQSEPMLKMYPEITFFHPLPTWARTRFAKADWVLKQRARERRGLSTNTTRKERRVLSELRNRTNTTGEDTTPNKSSFSQQKYVDETKPTEVDKCDEECTPEMVEVTARELKWPKAMIAQGFGPGVDEVARRKRRRRMILIGSAATVAVVAIAIGVAMKSQSNNNPHIQQHASNVPSAPKKSSGTQSRSHMKKHSSMGLSKPKSSGTKMSDFVGSMKTAAKDLLSENDAPSANCPADNIPAREPVPERSWSAPWPAVPSSAVGAPVNTNPNNSVIQMVIQKMFVNQLKALAYQLQLLMHKIDANVTSPAGRAILQRKVTEYAKSASSAVTKFAVHALQQAREHLGGDNNIEDLALL